MKKEQKPCEMDIVWKSRHIEPKEPRSIPITFRNMVYWRSFKDKVELFWLWLKGGNGLSFNKWLDEPREIVIEWTHIECKK
jgi:hypothetical protein